VKLVVGLGNPGRKYEGTRHNVGFVVLQLLARRRNADRLKANFQGETTEIDLAGERTILLWPQTYMNLSGASVLAARDFYKLSDRDVLVVSDDFNLPLGKLRMRTQGTAGGQKGLADILKRLGSDAIPRLRIGVGPVPPNWDPADFVLGKFTAQESTIIESATEQAADAVEDWVELGAEKCMNRYNA
jgi:PTH1 family peptidyl-tRNA hydrolase